MIAEYPWFFVTLYLGVGAVLGRWFFHNDRELRGRMSDDLEPAEAVAFVMFTVFYPLVVIILLLGGFAWLFICWHPTKTYTRVRDWYRRRQLLRQELNQPEIEE
jgi:hypothetical protein